MNKSIDIDVWKFLFNRLDDSQKKVLLQKENIRIGNMQSHLVSKPSQWNVLLKISGTNLTNKNIQKAIVQYYLEDIPNLKSDIENQEDHLENLDVLEQKDISSSIEEYGFFYVLIYLISKGYSEKVNMLIEFKPKETDNITESESESESDSNSVDLQNALQEIINLKNELSNMNKTNKSLKKKCDLLEAKFNDYKNQERKEIAILEVKFNNYKNQKNKEITILEEKQNSDIEEIFNNWDNDKQKYESKLKVLEDEIQILKKQLNKLNSNQRDQEQEFKFEIVEKSTLKKRQNKVLVFGKLPLNIQKDGDYNFVFFNHDISNYLFNEKYDEYWLIEDKLSAKEKKQLKNNINSSKVNLIKKNYNDLIR